MGKTAGVMKKESKNIKVKNVRKKNKVENIKVQENLKKKKARRFHRKGRGAIYISHIPHGFYEDEMTAYFSQFGKVVSVKVARSKKTGRSKGYAFVEFLKEEVAKIAADTMNNYMMYNRVLKCSYIPPEEWKGNSLPKISLYNCPRIKNRILDFQRKSKRIGEITDENYKVKAQKKIEGLKKFFEERGVEFMFKPFSTNNQENETSENNLCVSNVSCESESDPDKEFGVLEIDESDKELCFKTPPQVKKIIKKSVSKNSTKTINKAKLPKARKENVNLVKKLKQSSKSKVSKQKSKCKTGRKTSGSNVS